MSKLYEQIEQFRYLSSLYSRYSYFILTGRRLEYLLKPLYIRGRTILISDKYKFIYYPVNKAASTTLCQILSSIDRKRRYINPVKESYRYKDYQSYYHFTFVRNPWDRLVSCYKDKILKEDRNLIKRVYKIDRIRFDDFVKMVGKTPDYFSNTHFVSQYLSMRFKEPKEMNFIGRFETFEAELDSLLNVIIPARKINEIPRLNAGYPSGENYRKYYTDETRDIIAHRYKHDIELFDYRF